MSKIRFAQFLISIVAASGVYASDVDIVAKATNELGVDLYQQLSAGDDNLCLSPYSIQSALAMTFAGSDGETREEMGRVLHFNGENDAKVHASFASLRSALEDMAKATTSIVAQSKKTGGPSEPIMLAIANRLFAQVGYDIRDSFAEVVKRFYGAPLEPLDFKKNPERQRQHINKWVMEQTRNRIRDLIPPDGLTQSTRLVLANAIYLKAPWQSEFNDSMTKPQPFHVHGRQPVDVPTMSQIKGCGYVKNADYTAISLPYVGGELQFLILLPEGANGLTALEKKLNADTLAQCAKLKERDVDLSMPKFKFEPPTIPLGSKLQALGMKTAFDQPPDSANFDGIAPRKQNDYLAISEVFHKTFIAVDEKGTEAAAATAVAMLAYSAKMEKPKPVEVKVDQPFIYAIQHVPSGTCLFIGRVTDPR